MTDSEKIYEVSSAINCGGKFIGNTYNLGFHYMKVIYSIIPRVELTQFIKKYSREFELFGIRAARYFGEPIILFNSKNITYGKNQERL